MRKIVSTYTNVRDLKRLLFAAGHRGAQRLVLRDLLWRQTRSMLQHVEFHVGEAHLLERLHDRKLDLRHEELALHLLVLVVAHPIEIRL